MPQVDTLAAAQRLLATLAAGRAALLSVAAQRLPFDRLVALHVASNSETEVLESLHSAIDRRVASMRARIYSRVGEQPAVAEPVDDAPTPHGAHTMPMPATEAPPIPPRGRATARIARAIERAAESAKAEAEPVSHPPAAVEAAPIVEPVAAASVSAVPDAESVAEPEAPTAVADTVVQAAEPAVDPTPEPPTLVVEAAVSLPGATLVPDLVPEVVPPPPAVELPPVELPAAASPSEGDEQEDDAPSAPTLTPEPTDEYTPLGEMLPEDLVDDEAVDSPNDEPSVGPLRIALPTTSGASPRASGATANADGPIAAGPATVDMRARAVSPAGVRVAGAEAEDTEDPPSNVEAGGEEAVGDDEVGSGESVGGGLRVGGGERAGRRASAPSLAPRLTDDDDAGPTNVLAETPTAAPAGDDGRVKQMGEEAQAQAERGDLQKAIATFTDVIDLRHDRMDAYIGRGRCHLELGDYSSAMSDFQRAEDLQPDRPDSHVAMGDLYFARKEYRRAIEFYDQAVELDGSHAMARCRRGISHYYRKNYRQAFQDLQRAYSLDPEIPNIRKYVQMAVKKMERGD